MLRSNRLRVFKSSSHPKREGFHNTIKYKLQSTTKQSSKHLKKRKLQKSKSKKKLPVLQLKSQLKKKEKREKKNWQKYTIRVIGKNHVTNSKAGNIDLSVRMVVPEKESTLIE